MNKKGISLVALVITIIVLIILTGAVIITGVNVPTNASQAVADTNKATIQDAVTLAIMNHIATHTTASTAPVTVQTAIEQLGIIDGTFGSDTSKALVDDAVEVLNLNGISETQITGYSISTTGVVTGAANN